MDHTLWSNSHGPYHMVWFILLTQFYDHDSRNQTVCHSMGTFVGSQYACLYPEAVESLTLLDYHGIQLFQPYLVPRYSAMGFENRYDRWKYDQKGIKSNAKTYETFKNALMHGKEPQKTWFADERG